MAFTTQDNIDDVRVVIDAVIRCRVGSTAKRPGSRFLHHISPLSCAKPVLAADDDDVAIVRNVRTDDILADGEGDGFCTHIAADIDTASRSAPGLSLHGLHRARLARTADGHFPGPIRMHFCIGTGEHRGTPVGSFTLVHVNLNDLVAEAIRKAPYIGHLAHRENKLGVPSALPHGQVRSVPKASTVGCVEIARQRIDVVAITRFVAHSIVQLQQRHPLLKVGQDHLCRCWWRHFSVNSITV